MAQITLVSQFVMLSYGMASVAPAPDKTPSFLIKQADEMLFQAKKKGCNRIEKVTIT